MDNNLPYVSYIAECPIFLKNSCWSGVASTFERDVFYTLSLHGIAQSDKEQLLYTSSHKVSC